MRHDPPKCLAKSSKFGGFVTDSCNTVVPMLGYIYFQDTQNAVPSSKGDIIKGSLSIGMVIGQIIFGILGDTIGRHRVYGKELLLTMSGTLMCVLMPWRGLSQNGIIAWMSVWRVLTGIGIGGGQYASVFEHLGDLLVGQRLCLLT